MRDSQHDLYERTEQLGITDRFLSAYQRYDQALGLVIEQQAKKYRAGILNSPHSEAELAALDELRDSRVEFRSLLHTVREPV
jgi:hypothetical protein